MHEHNEKIPPMMLADGFSGAFIGTADDFAGHPRAVYDYDKCIRILRYDRHLTEEEAFDFMEFNVVGAFVGAATPIFMHRMSYRQLMSDQ